MLVKAKRELFWGLADLNRCKTVGFGKNGRDYSMLIGFESDRNHVKVMFNSIMLQLQTDMVREERNGVCGPVRGWRTAFAHGYVRRVLSRLRAAQTATVANVPGSALVLRDRSALVEDKFGQMFPKLRKATTKTSTGNADGYRRGDAAGSRADLGGARVGGVGRDSITG